MKKKTNWKADPKTIGKELYQAVTKDLTSSTNFSESCVLTFQSVLKASDSHFDSVTNQQRCYSTKQALNRCCEKGKSIRKLSSGESAHHSIEPLDGSRDWLPLIYLSELIMFNAESCEEVDWGTSGR